MDPQPLQLDPESPQAQVIHLMLHPAPLTPQAPPQMAGLSIPDSLPQTPRMASPNAKLAPVDQQTPYPKGTLLGDKQELQKEEEKKPFLESVYSDIAHSGFGEKHPILGKVLGGIAQIPSTIADIGASAVAPRIGSLIPGTSINHSLQVGATEGRIGQEEKNAQTEATTEAEKERGAEEESQGREADARTYALEHPEPQPAEQEKWKPLLGGNGQVVTAPNGNIVEVNDQGELRAENLPEGASVAPKPGAQPHDPFHEWLDNPQKFDEFLKEQTAAKGTGSKGFGQFAGVYAAYHVLHEAYAHNPALLPILGPMLAGAMQKSGLPVPQDAASVISRVPEGQPLSPETGNPIGTAMPEAPTGPTRTQAQVAARVLDVLPSVRKEVTDDASNLGPVAGRLAVGFLLGTVGSTGDAAEDKRLSELRADLTFTGSGAAKFHINSVRAMEQYDKLIAAGKNTADAINGTLDSVEKWATSAQAQERGYGETGSPPPPAWSVPQGAPSAPKQDGKYLYADGKPVAKSQGGKWVHP